MAARIEMSLRERLLILVLGLVAVFASWAYIRSSLLVESASYVAIVHFIDIGIVSAAGITTVVLLTQWISRPLASYVGPTQSNAVKLMIQLVGLSLILLIAVSAAGTNLIGTLVGVGFFGIVIGLAAQSVLGNLLSGIMLLASRPFHINDRIALITWQYGKFPPTLPHGWLEPSYTGTVKGIALIYTRILTDSNAMLKIPNSIVTQSLILNVSHGRQSYIATQFEISINIDPDELHKRLQLKLSKDKEFQAEEQAFELLEMSPTGYLVAVNYSVEKGREREMKPLLFKALRHVLVNYSNERNLE